MRTIQDLENEVLEILDEFDGEYVVTDFDLKAQSSLQMKKKFLCCQTLLSMYNTKNISLWQNIITK